MAVFWIVLGAALVALIGYAAYADHLARRDGQVLVPVKRGHVGRTTFVRMSRTELDEQKAIAVVAEQERQRSERARSSDGVPTVKLFGGIFGDTSRRLRRR